jgi:hypothetical protein
MNMFEVSTLGQPLEVVKTQMASNRCLSRTCRTSHLKTGWQAAGYGSGVQDYLEQRRRPGLSVDSWLREALICVQSTKDCKLPREDCATASYHFDRIPWVSHHC